MTRGQRLSLIAVVLGIGIALAVGSAAAGAATAPPPLPDHSSIQSVNPPAEPAENEPQTPKRFSAIGVIVGIREQVIAVRIKGRERPVLVALRPMTALRIHGKPAHVEDLHLGDPVVVVGRPGPRGNVIVARGVNVVREDKAQS